MVNWWGLTFGGNNKHISSFVLLWSSRHVNSHVFPTQLEGWLPINNGNFSLCSAYGVYAWIPFPWEMYTHLKNDNLYLLFWMHFWNGCNDNSAIILVHGENSYMIFKACLLSHYNHPNGTSTWTCVESVPTDRQTHPKSFGKFVLPNRLKTLWLWLAANHPFLHE